eukprot:1455862-Lingulodinium_polyedra.AAC.1
MASGRCPPTPFHPGGAWTLLSGQAWGRAEGRAFRAQGGANQHPHHGRMLAGSCCRNGATEPGA